MVSAVFKTVGCGNTVVGSIPASSEWNPMSQLARLPQIESLLNEPVIGDWFSRLSRTLVTAIVRESVDKCRSEMIASLGSNSLEETSSESSTLSRDEIRQNIVATIDRDCEKLFLTRLRPVINATGVVLHTNLGRSPIGQAVWREAERINTGYSNLEFDVEEGVRGSRGGLAPLLLARATGADDAIIVNNCAAALFLSLSSLASGREVIVSRGEQIQIGGGFRIPDMLRLSGAELVEIGTTNFTTVDDYLQAITERSAIALVVHTSNFRIEGFNASPDLSELNDRLPEEILLVVDQGSGALHAGVEGEPRVSAIIEAGADLVTFSCDKLLGGPQAGVIAGRKDLIDRLRSHPLMRVLRTGKTVLSLLEARLLELLDPAKERKDRAIGVNGITQTDVESIRLRCENVRAAIGAEKITVVESQVTPGGGSAPGTSLPSYSIRIESDTPPNEIARRLRSGPLPIVGVIDSNRVELNLGTVADSETSDLIDAIRTLEG